MTKPVETAFILAAGLGRRLLPYTETLPKPMVPVAGKPVIDHIIDKLVASGVRRVIVNLHHRGDILREHLSRRSDIEILFSQEESLLDTGGGIEKALDLVGPDPFFIINGDAFWEDADSDNAFTRLHKMWERLEDTSDLVLLLQPVSEMKLTRGVGDYRLEGQRAVRCLDQKGEYMFAGVRLCHPRLFAGAPGGVYSFLKLMDKADRQDRLHGLIHKGAWHHISTPEELQAVEASYQKHQNTPAVKAS